MQNVGETILRKIQQKCFSSLISFIQRTVISMAETSNGAIVYSILSIIILD